MVDTVLDGIALDMRTVKVDLIVLAGEVRSADPVIREWVNYRRETVEGMKLDVGLQLLQVICSSLAD